MDREALVRRNRQMAEAFHQQPLRHRLRHGFIHGVSRFPFAPLNRGWNRILFIKPDHMGDMLLATPAMRALKAARPYSEIHVLANSASAQLLANYPEVDLVLTANFPGFERNTDKSAIYSPYTHLIRVSRQLRHIGYGTAIVMRPDHWWGAMLAHVAGIRQRIGYNLPDVEPFLTQAIEHRHEHVIRQNMRLVEQWTGHVPDTEIEYTFMVYDDDAESINTYLGTFGINSEDRILCIHPGSGAWVKQWDEDKWATVADTLIDQLDAQVVFTGSDSERAMIARIQNRMTHHSTTSAGDLDIGQLAALYDRALVVLGPDSGPMHLAAAVGTGTVTLFGPADPVEFGIWGSTDKHYVLTTPIGCRPCRVLDWGDDAPENHPCVREIPVGQVLESARRAATAK